jgi:hypothetical protein
MEIYRSSPQMEITVREYEKMEEINGDYCLH